MSDPVTFLNEHAGGRAARSAPAPPEPYEFHRRFAEYRPSPLVEAPELAAGLGVGRLLVKDESSRLGLPSFKMLGASWASYRALADQVGRSLSLEAWRGIDDLARLLEPYRPLTLVAATDGNHGRAVARFAALVGLEAAIYVPEGTARARIEAIEGEGASCSVVEGSYDDAVARSAEDASPRHLVVSDTSWPGYTTIPGYVIEGYSTIFREVEDQLGGERLDSVVVPVGVGALAASVVRAYRSDPRQWPAIIGVEPKSAACVLESVRAGAPVLVPGPHRSIMAGLNCGRPSEIAFPLLMAGVDAFVAIDDEPVRDAMVLLAAEGVVSGETGAAALAGARELCASGIGEEERRRLGLGPTSTVLVISSEGATDPEAYRTIVGRDQSAVEAGR